MLSHIESILDKNLNAFEEKIAENIEKKFNIMLEETENKKVLFFTKCDACSIYPIPGAKFSCLVCNNYNLCAECESYHNHPTLKFKTLEFSNNSQLSEFISKKINENKIII